MKRISVDIGGTFTDCFFAWEGQYIQAKALTTHHNLAQGFNEALDHACGQLAKNDLSSATRPDPLVPQRLIRSVRERIDYAGRVLLAIDEDDVRHQLRELVDAGAQALVVCLTNAVENPTHELSVQEIFLEEYPAHQLGALPMLLSH